MPSLWSSMGTFQSGASLTKISNNFYCKPLGYNKTEYFRLPLTDLLLIHLIIASMLHSLLYFTSQLLRSPSLSRGSSFVQWSRHCDNGEARYQGPRLV